MIAYNIMGYLPSLRRLSGVPKKINDEIMNGYGEYMREQGVPEAGIKRINDKYTEEYTRLKKYFTEDVSSREARNYILTDMNAEIDKANTTMLDRLSSKLVRALSLSSKLEGFRGSYKGGDKLLVMVCIVVMMVMIRMRLRR